MAKHIRHCCKDCGITTGMDWWHANYTASGPHGARCHDCYLAYTRDKQNARMHGRVYANRALWAPKPLGPPTPPGQLVTCPDCGNEHWRRQSTLRCPACTIANEAARRGTAMARRLTAERRGDKGITWQAVADRDGWNCHLCGKVVRKLAGIAKQPLGATVDHLIPIADGGEHVWANVALAHRRCNIARGSRGLAQLRLVG